MTSFWRSVPLAEVANFKTGKLDSNAAVDGGVYPFFTCAPATLAIDTYAFDAEAVLLAGNNASGQFPLKYYKGKFNAYQRTYVITPIDSSGLVSSRFLYYSLMLALDEFQQLSVGSATKFLTKKILDNFHIPLPSSAEQRTIANILGTLDDKIIHHDRQIANLREVATTLFKAWFLDFFPVRAKAEGRRPFGLDAETSELFPDAFEDSDLDRIPAGWSAVTLADIVTERTAKIGEGNDHEVLSAIASGELKRSEEHFTKQVYSQDTSKYKRVEQWDYAYNPSRINIGSIGMLEEPIVGAVSPVYTVLRPAEGYEWFLRFFLDLPQTREVINQFCSGSVRQSLSFKDFAAIPVVLPPKEIAEAFTRRWRELNRLRQKLAMQSSKLADVRDTLLPKLMSGELRVPDELMA